MLPHPSDAGALGSGALASTFLARVFRFGISERCRVTDRDPKDATTEATPIDPKQPLWRRVLPFVVALGLVAFVLFRTDLHAFAADLEAVDVPAFFGFTVAFVLSLLTADAFATTIVYRRSVAPLDFKSFWILRGASYLPSLLNHHVGQLFITVALSRRYKVPLARMAGGTLVVYASWMGCVAGLLTFALAVSGYWLLWPALIVVAGLGYLAIVEVRPARLARVTWLAPLFEAGVRGHLVAMLARVPHVIVLFVGTWLPFWFFGVKIPFSNALMTIPIVMVVVTLPISPQGLGPRDMLAPFFYLRFAPGATDDARRAALAAATTSWAVAFTLVEILVGVSLLRWAVRADERPKTP